MISGEEKINSNKAAKYQEKKKKGSKIIFRSKILGVVVCNVYHLTLDLIYISIDARADIVLGKYMENNKKKKKKKRCPHSKSLQKNYTQICITIYN